MIEQKPLRISLKARREDKARQRDELDTQQMILLDKVEEVIESFKESPRQQSAPAQEPPSRSAATISYRRNLDSARPIGKLLLIILVLLGGAGVTSGIFLYRSPQPPVPVPTYAAEIGPPIIETMPAKSEEASHPEPSTLAAREAKPAAASRHSKAKAPQKATRYSESL